MIFGQNLALYPFETRGLTSPFIPISILYPYYMLCPHSKLLFTIEFKREHFSMKTTRLELYQGSFVNYLIQNMLLLLWKLVKRLLCGVQARTRTIKYVRQDLHISTTNILWKFLHTVKFSILV